MNLLAENELMQQSVKQAGDALIAACWKIAGIVLIMAIIAFIFMFIKYKIKKKIKEKKEENKKK